MRTPERCKVDFRKACIITELVKDSVDPPRVMPLVGPVQLHHVQWQCIVYFTEVIHANGRTPETTIAEDCEEVIYIDRDHVHRAGNPESAALPSSSTKK